MKLTALIAFTTLASLGSAIAIQGRQSGSASDLPQCVMQCESVLRAGFTRSCPTKTEACICASTEYQVLYTCLRRACTPTELPGIDTDIPGFTCNADAAGGADGSTARPSSTATADEGDFDPTGSVSTGGASTRTSAPTSSTAKPSMSSLSGVTYSSSSFGAKASTASGSAPSSSASVGTGGSSGGSVGTTGGTAGGTTGSGSGSTGSSTTNAQKSGVGLKRNAAGAGAITILGAIVAVLLL